MARRYVTVTSRRVEITTNEEVRQKHAKTMDQIARCFEKAVSFCDMFLFKDGFVFDGYVSCVSLKLLALCSRSALPK